MEQLDDLRVFVETVRLQSFSQAARVLGLPKSTVSRRIARLESDLGVALITRTTRKLKVTPEGDRLHRSASQALDLIRGVEQDIRDDRTSQSGTVSITAPVAFSGEALARVLAKYKKEFPQVQVSILLSDEIIDMVKLGLDIAVRAGNLKDSALIAKRLGTDEFWLVASPSMNAQLASVKSPQDLLKVPCVASTGGELDGVWNLVKGRTKARVEPRFAVVVNQLGIARDFSIHGGGVTFLPRSICWEDIEQGRLVRVLPEWASVREPLHLVYPKQKYLSPKVRTMIDLLAETLKRECNRDSLPRSAR